MNNPSIAIGGIGGSGTRAVSKMFQELGYFMGDDLNEQLDALLYTLMFKRKEILLLDKEAFRNRLNLFYDIMTRASEISDKDYSILNALAENDNNQHDKVWLKKRVENLQLQTSFDNKPWGWKEPNTHIVIDKILDNTPHLKFIYVYRNGLDMAYSSNQNQLNFWGAIFLNQDSIENNPHNSLRYWCEVHKRITRLKQTYKNQISLLDFDAICQNPKKHIKNIFEFLEYKNSDKLENISDIFKKQTSYGRYKNHTLEYFAKDDLEYISRTLDIDINKPS